MCNCLSLRNNVFKNKGKRTLQYTQTKNTIKRGQVHMYDDEQCALPHKKDNIREHVKHLKRLNPKHLLSVNIKQEFFVNI